FHINGLIANYYTNAQVSNILSGKHNTITSSTNSTINKLICNSLEPTTTVNTDMIIKANRVLFGYTITHTLLSGAASYFYSVAEFRNLVFCDNVAVGYRDANDIFVARFNINKNGNAYTYGNCDVAGNLSASNIYNKTQVENLLTAKQNTLTFRDPTQLNPPVQGFPLLGGGNIVPCISFVPPLSLTYNGNDYIEIGLDVDLSLKADKSTTYTKSEADGLLTNKASITYVDNAIAAKSTQPTITTNTLTTSSGSGKCKFEPSGNGYVDGTIMCKCGLHVGYIAIFFQ
ncbi:MAG: hypothetical protein ACKPKO_55645, partial [Candidatus Fonsibacter sp.]